MASLLFVLTYFWRSRWCEVSELRDILGMYLLKSPIGACHDMYRDRSTKVFLYLVAKPPKLMVSSSMDWDTNWAFTDKIAIIKIQKTEDVTRIFMILFNEIRHPE